MTAAEDRLMLEEFSLWRATRPEAVDSSVAAFLKEREDEANERRIAEALQLFDGNDLRAAFNLIEDPTHFEERAMSVLTDIERALVDDREYSLDRTLTGPTTRRFV